MSWIAALVAIAALGADAGPMTELQYSGVLRALPRGEERIVVKNFDVICLVSESAGDAQQRDVIHLVVEDGSSAVAWPERFGRQTVSTAAAGTLGNAPQILYVHQDRAQLLRVFLPYLPQPAKLAEDAEWSDDRYRYSVVRSLNVDGRDCWQVEATPVSRGSSMLLTVEAGTGLIVAGTQRLTMGQGDLFELTWQLDDSKSVAPDVAERSGEAAELLLDLQSKLARQDAGASPALTDEQLNIAADTLAPLQDAAAGTQFEKLAAVISRDVQSQRQRAQSVDELAQKFVGQPAPKFQLQGLDGQPITADWADKTLVLHFWDYRDEPLEEPYGQVGYLDFLTSRHKNVVVYGVAVDPRLRDPSTTGAARRSARKLKSFMNLGYDIAADADGAVLKAFGDPTQFEASLPLWVVIAPDGTVVHYRTGYYKVDRDRGLTDLDQAVSAAAD